MPSEIAGILIVPFIVALVGMAKGLGLDARWAPVAAVAFGLLIFAGNQAAQIVPAFKEWFTVILWGIAAGLMAVGLYSATKNTIGS